MPYTKTNYPRIRDFASAEALLGGKPSRPLLNNTRLVRVDADTIAVALHGTFVVTYHRSGRVTVDSGGWRTVTTKDRINRFAPVHVQQRRGEWYVGDGAFRDGMQVQ